MMMTWKSPLVNLLVRLILSHISGVVHEVSNNITNREMKASGIAAIK